MQSELSQTAEWRVDLKSVLSIHHILIQYAQDNPVWGMHFFIYLTLVEMCIHVFQVSFNFIVLQV